MLAVNRVTELMETKPDIIVTHCPGCIMQLKDGLRKLKVEGVEVLDLSEVVATAMEHEKQSELKLSRILKAIRKK